MKKRLILYIFVCNIFSVDFKPWEDWWEKNYQFCENEFKSWIGDINAPSRALIRGLVKLNDYKNVLDVGSGLCIDFEGFKFHNINIEYNALEITSKFIDEGKKKGVNIIFGNIEEIPYKDNSFDFVYCRHVLEHLSDYEKPISEMIRVASKGIAIVFFIQPNDQQDLLDLSDISGSLLFQNRYNKQKLENYINSLSKVKKLNWILFEKEAVLHVSFDV